MKPPDALGWAILTAAALISAATAAYQLCYLFLP